MRGIQIAETGGSQVLKYFTDLPKPILKTGIKNMFELDYTTFL